MGTLHFPSDLALTDDAYGSIIHAVEDSCGIYGELDLMDGMVAQELAGCVGDLNVEAAKIADIQDEDLRLSYENVSREFAVLAAGAGADAESIDIIHQQLLQLSLYSILSFITFSNTPNTKSTFCRHCLECLHHLLIKHFYRLVGPMVAWKRSQRSVKFWRL